MSCQHIPTSTVKSVTCCEPPPEARKPPGPVLSSTPSTMPRGWLQWSVWSGLRRCCSPRRTCTSSSLGRDESLLNRNWYLEWYIMLDSVPLGPNSDHFYKRRAARRKKQQAASYPICLSFQVTFPWEVKCKLNFGNSRLSEVRRELTGLWEVDGRKLLLVNLFVSHKFFLLWFYLWFITLVNSFRFAYFCLTLS